MLLLLLFFFRLDRSLLTLLLLLLLLLLAELLLANRGGSLAALRAGTVRPVVVHQDELARIARVAFVRVRIGVHLGELGRGSLRVVRRSIHIKRPILEALLLLLLGMIVVEAIRLTWRTWTWNKSALHFGNMFKFKPKKS